MVRNSFMHKNKAVPFSDVSFFSFKKLFRRNEIEPYDLAEINEVISNVFQLQNAQPYGTDDLNLEIGQRKKYKTKKLLKDLLAQDLREECILDTWSLFESTLKTEIEPYLNSNFSFIKNAQLQSFITQEEVGRFFGIQNNERNSILHLRQEASMSNDNIESFINRVHSIRADIANTKIKNENFDFAKELGEYAYESQDFKEAFNWFYKVAKFNDSYCQNKIAQMYSEGLGVDVDKSKAMDWYFSSISFGNSLEELKNLADKENNPEVQFKLALIYEKGDGSIRKDTHQAFRLFIRAAENGYSQAFNKTEEMMSNDRSIARDKDIPDVQKFSWKFIKLFINFVRGGNKKAFDEIRKKANDRNNFDSNLSYLYANSMLPKFSKQFDSDGYKEILKTYAKQGYLSAFIELKKCAKKGERFAKNFLSQLSKESNEIAKKLCDDLELKNNDDDIVTIAQKEIVQVPVNIDQNAEPKSNTPHDSIPDTNREADEIKIPPPPIKTKRPLTWFEKTKNKVKSFYRLVFE
jgi:TPR repeat protein